MDIRLAKNSDKYLVIDLFKKAFNNKLSEKYWEWRYSKFGEPIRTVAFENDILVGHVVAQPLLLKIGETIEYCLFLMDGMTHPDFRGKKIFQQVLEYTHKEAEKRNYKLSFGFSNENAAKTHFEKLKMIKMGKLIEFRRNILTNESYIHENDRLKISPIQVFKEEVDSIWETNKIKYHNLLKRTKDYLNWRYIENPGIKNENWSTYKYSCFYVTLDERPLTYFVMKAFNKERGHLIDFYGDLSESVMKKILQFGIEFCKNQNLPQLTFWMNNDLVNSYSPLFSKLGFIKYWSNAIFGIQNYDDKIYDSIKSRKSWYVTMGDSDVF